MERVRFTTVSVTRTPNSIFCILGKTVVLVEKAKRLARRGEKVAFLLCYNPQGTECSEVSSSEHFLYQELRSRFADCGENLTLEFVKICKVMERITQLAGGRDSVNIFVDEYSYGAHPRHSDKDSPSFVLPEVLYDDFSRDQFVKFPYLII